MLRIINCILYVKWNRNTSNRQGKPSEFKTTPPPPTGGTGGAGARLPGTSVFMWKLSIRTPLCKSVTRMRHRPGPDGARRAAAGRMRVTSRRDLDPEVGQEQAAANVNSGPHARRATAAGRKLTWKRPVVGRHPRSARDGRLAFRFINDE